jgi:hypothetical protein
MVMPYVHNPDMLSAAQKGIELGAMINRLPRAAHENAAQSAMASIAQEQGKNLQDQFKFIRADKTLTPEQKSQKMQQALMESGFTYAPGGGGFDPLGAAVRAQGLATAQQAYQQSAQSFPLEQQTRQTNLAGGVQAVQAGTTNPVQPAQPTNPAQPAQPVQPPKQEHLLNQNPQKTTMVQGGDNTQVAQADLPVAPVAPVAPTLTNYLNQYPAPATFLA